MENYVEKCAKAFPGSAGERYLKDRGFSDRILKEYLIGYDVSRRAITIPYPKTDYYLARYIDKASGETNKYYKPAGRSEPLFMVGNPKAETAFYGEGQLDVLSLIQAGAPCAAAVGGTGAGKLMGAVLPKTGIVIADNDEPGERAAENIREILKKKGIAVAVVHPPEGFKDSNDILKNNPEQLAALVKEWLSIEPEPAETVPEKGREADGGQKSSLGKFHRWSEPNRNGTSKPLDILDDAIAEDIIRENKIFCLGGKLYLYDSGIYRRDTDGAIIKTMIGQYIFDSLRNIKRINRVYDLLVSKASIRKDFDGINNYPEYWIPFSNGMLDVKTLELKEHSPDYLAINQLPREWEPKYKTDDPVFEKFLSGMMPDPEDREMFLAYCGYCLTRSTFLQKLLILLGPGGLGKSELLSLLQSIAGSENTSSLSLQEVGERFSRAELLGKLVNICADIPSTAMQQIDALKKVTGEDAVKGEYKGGAVFFFRPYSKLIFSANRIPHSLDDRTDAFYRRLLIVPIRQRGPDIPDLRNRLQADADSFVHAAVMAAHRMFTAGKIEESENSKAAVVELYRDTDPIQAFLLDKTIRKPGGTIERTALFRAYEKYCTEEERQSTSRNGFYSGMREKGYYDHKSHGGRYFVGIDWKPEEWEPVEGGEPFW